MPDYFDDLETRSPQARERALLDQSVRERDAAEATAKEAERAKQQCAREESARREAAAQAEAERLALLAQAQTAAPALGCFTQCLAPTPPPPQHCKT